MRGKNARPNTAPLRKKEHPAPPNVGQRLGRVEASQVYLAASGLSHAHFQGPKGGPISPQRVPGCPTAVGVRAARTGRRAPKKICAILKGAERERKLGSALPEDSWPQKL